MQKKLTNILHVFRSTTSERLTDRFWRALISTPERICIEATPAAGEAGAAALVPSREIYGFQSQWVYCA